jgi:hypothetical protein
MKGRGEEYSIKASHLLVEMVWGSCGVQEVPNATGTIYRGGYNATTNSK